MDINNLRPDPAPAHRIDGVSPVREDSRPPESSVEHDQADVDNGDTVEISDEARARAAEAGNAADIPSGTLSADRLTELRRRIVDRAHDTDLMADEVMRRIADNGDLW
jgi:hypothetical protein